MDIGKPTQYQWYRTLLWYRIFERKKKAYVRYRFRIIVMPLKRCYFCCSFWGNIRLLTSLVAPPLHGQGVFARSMEEDLAANTLVVPKGLYQEDKRVVARAMEEDLAANTLIVP